MKGSFKTSAFMNWKIVHNALRRTCSWTSLLRRPGFDLKRCGFDSCGRNETEQVQMTVRNLWYGAIAQCTEPDDRSHISSWVPPCSADNQWSYARFPLSSRAQFWYKSEYHASWVVLRREEAVQCLRSQVPFHSPCRKTNRAKNLSGELKLPSHSIARWLSADVRHCSIAALQMSSRPLLHGLQPKMQMELSNVLRLFRLLEGMIISHHPILSSAAVSTFTFC